jgi:hypothetical protein
MKRCTTCKKERPVTEFGRNKSTPDGLQRQCKDCRADGYFAAKARKANGDPGRVKDDSITEGNPLSDPFSPEGWRVTLSVANAVAGRIYRQHHGWHPWSIADLESAAIEWISEHRAEASRCQTEAMAVVKIAERVRRVWAKSLDPDTAPINDFPIHVIDHELMMDVVVKTGDRRPGESVARAALRSLHQRATDYPYIDAMAEMDRVSYDRIEGWTRLWDRSKAGAPKPAEVGRFVEGIAHESNGSVKAHGGYERAREYIDAFRAGHPGR